MNIGNVLVPVDFSLPSQVAINYGVVLARRFEAHLTLLHVLGPKGATPSRREEAMQRLSSFLAPEDEDDLDLRIVLKPGDIRDGVVTTIHEQHADIVVMGTHGGGRVGRWLMGSTTQHLLRKLPVPVMTVRSGIRPMQFERILFATDLSDASKRVFPFALDLARTLHSSVVVVHVLPPAPATALDESAIAARESGARNAQRVLSDLEAEATKSQVKVETVLAEGDAADRILKAARNADILAIAVERKRAVEKALLGATAERLVREADAPVLSIPANLS